MNRRNFLRNTGILAGTGLLLQNKAFASIFSPYDFNIKMLRNNIGIFTEKGGTIGFLLGKNGTVVIDAQFPDSATHLIEELKKKNTNPLRFLLNTHHHGDHTSGNIAFKGIVDNVIAQENSLINQKAVAEKNNNLDKQLLPDKAFKYEMTIKADDDKIDANYYGPGHNN
jgi:glyoxylase-like metal-dependent hydrolase (beta-lactamase superfamily II)